MFIREDFDSLYASLFVHFELSLFVMPKKVGCSVDFIVLIQKLFGVLMLGFVLPKAISIFF